MAIVAFLRTMQWVDKDATPARLPREPINIGLWALLSLALGLIVFLPNFFMALGATVVLLAGGVVGYLAWRNTTVGLKDIPDQLVAYLKGLVSPKKKDQGQGEGARGDGRGRQRDAHDQVGQQVARRRR